MRGRHHAPQPCMECSLHPCLCGNFNYPRRHHRAAERDWIDYMSERNTRAARIAKARQPRPLRYFTFVALAFSVVVFAFCVYLVAR